MGVLDFKGLAQMAYHAVVDSDYANTNQKSPAEILAVMRNDMHRALQRMDEEDKVLPPKTVAERKAGRRSLVNKLRASIVDVGHDELRRRFAKTARFHISHGDDEQVSVVVHAGRNKPMTFTDHIMEFPSEMLIAQITLLAG